MLRFFAFCVLAVMTSTIILGAGRDQSSDTAKLMGDPAIYADTIYKNATIWNGNDYSTFAEALAVKDGEILSIGLSDIVERHRGPQTAVIDLLGKFVTPGFVDSHVHFMDGGFALSSVQLRDVRSPEEFSTSIGDYAASASKGRWILGGNWDHEAWNGALPEKSWIDNVTPDNPVYVHRLDGHMGLANSLALKLAGIDKNTPDPHGGEIVRDVNGEPTGVLKDAAIALVHKVIPSPTDDELDNAYDSAVAHALSRGVTMVHDMADWESLETYQRAQVRGAAHLRIYSLTRLQYWERLADYVKDNGRGDDWLMWGGVKGFVDGSLGSTTAWFYQPYADAPDTSGLIMHDLDALKQTMQAADKAGLQLAIHAIGDRANDWALDAFEEITMLNGERDRRFRIEHAQHLTRDAISRFRRIGVIASMQPYHAIDDGRWAEKRIGAERIKTTYAFRSLLDAGVLLAFGSDWTVAPIDVLSGVYAATTRRTLDGANPEGWTPEEKIALAEVLEAYTAAGAYASFQENEIGRLHKGMKADFVVFSENLFESSPAEIKNIRVLKTVVGGDIKFEAE